MGSWDSVEVLAMRMPRIEHRSANVRHEICRCCGSENNPRAQFPILIPTTKIKTYESAYSRSNGMKGDFGYLTRRTVYQWHFGRCYIKKLERQ